MCTLAWVPGPGGYTLVMSRDEKHARPAARPPQRSVSREMPVLSPTDPESGGSWVSVNLAGHALALLNRYEESPAEPEPEGPWVSRGRLIPDLGHLATSAEVGSALAVLPLSNYRPFTLASVTPSGEAWLFDWDGKALEQGWTRTGGLLRTSSSVAQAEAEVARARVFQQVERREGRLTALVLEELFKSHLPERGPLSICMHRDDAETVSLSLITVFKSEIWFRYVAGPPCESTTEIIRRLTRSNIT